jgi:predicted RNA-binding Zn-ribbon protein involved in translation (DUF1610 family)
MAMTPRLMACPHCQFCSDASRDEPMGFEARGQFNGKAVRRCTRCGGGFFVSLRLAWFGGSPEPIPAPLWQRMQEVWNAQFTGTRETETRDAYFELLGVSTDCSDEELTRAHRDLVKVWHPDRFAQEPRLQVKAQEQIKQINQAYSAVRQERAARGAAAGSDTGTTSAKASRATVACIGCGQALRVPRRGRYFRCPQCGQEHDQEGRPHAPRPPARAETWTDSSVGDAYRRARAAEAIQQASPIACEKCGAPCEVRKSWAVCPSCGWFAEQGRYSKTKPERREPSRDEDNGAGDRDVCRRAREAEATRQASLIRCEKCGMPCEATKSWAICRSCGWLRQR